MSLLIPIQIPKGERQIMLSMVGNDVSLFLGFSFNQISPSSEHQLLSPDKQKEEDNFLMNIEENHSQ